MEEIEGEEIRWEGGDIILCPTDGWQIIFILIDLLWFLLTIT